MNNDSRILGWFADLIDRLFERETIVSAVGIYLVVTGRITTLEEALAMVTIISTVVIGRSMVKQTPNITIVAPDDARKLVE